MNAMIQAPFKFLPVDANESRLWFNNLRVVVRVWRKPPNLVDDLLGFLAQRCVRRARWLAKGRLRKPLARSHADHRVLSLVTEDPCVIVDDFVSVLSGFLGHG